MCSIIVSQSELKFKELVGINQKRGSFSFSYIAPIVKDYEEIEVETIYRGWDEFDTRVINSNAFLHIGHTQAPTSGLVKDKNRIHPAIQDTAYLFHNGILKADYVKFLQTRYKTEEPWDTRLLLMRIQDVGLGCLSEVDGSFACIYLANKQMLVFRNEIAPLFIDRDGNLSSLKFDGAMPVPPNEVFRYSFNQTYLTPTDRRFTTKNNPYVF